jgi:hypothetical protein
MLHVSYDPVCAYVDHAGNFDLKWKGRSQSSALLCF